MLKFQKSEKRIKIRTARGVQLIEMLASLLIAGMLAGVLGSSLSEVIRVCTSSDRNFLAMTAAQEIISRVRSTPYDELPADGIHDVQINIGDGDEPPVSPNGGFVSQRPVMLDNTQLSWQTIGGTNALPPNKLRGAATLNIEALPIPDTKRVLVTIKWFDSTSKGERIYTTGTVITKNGIVRHQ